MLTLFHHHWLGFIIGGVSVVALRILTEYLLLKFNEWDYEDEYDDYLDSLDFPEAPRTHIPIAASFSGHRMYADGNSINCIDCGDSTIVYWNPYGNPYNIVYDIE